jgi:hypothetical protein
VRSTRLRAPTKSVKQGPARSAAICVPSRVEQARSRVCQPRETAPTRCGLSAWREAYRWREDRTDHHRVVGPADLLLRWRGHLAFRAWRPAPRGKGASRGRSLPPLRSRGRRDRLGDEPLVRVGPHPRSYGRAHSSRARRAAVTPLGRSVCCRDQTVGRHGIDRHSTAGQRRGRRRGDPRGPRRARTTGRGVRARLGNARVDRRCCGSLPRAERPRITRADTNASISRPARCRYGARGQARRPTPPPRTRPRSPALSVMSAGRSQRITTLRSSRAPCDPAIAPQRTPSLAVVTSLPSPTDRNTLHAQRVLKMSATFPSRTKPQQTRAIRALFVTAATDDAPTRSACFAGTCPQMSAELRQDVRD